MMGSMDYLLTPAQNALKEAVRKFVASEVAPLRSVAAPDWGIADALILKLEEFVRRRKGGLETEESMPLSRVEAVMILEEVLKAIPAAGLKLASERLFDSLSPELRSSAALLGSAQGVLAPCLLGDLGRRGLKAYGHDCPGLDQELADVLSAVEAARLMTYRAAILEDEGRPEEEEASDAKRQAEKLASRAADLAELIKKGEP